MTGSTHTGKWVYAKKEDKQGTKKEADSPYRQLISSCARTFRLATPQNSTRSNWVPGNSATSVGSSSSWLRRFQSATHTRWQTHTHTHHNYRGPISDVKPSFSWWQDETTNGCRWLACVGLPLWALPLQTAVQLGPDPEESRCRLRNGDIFFLHRFWFSASFVLMLHNSAVSSAADQVKR